MFVIRKLPRSFSSANAKAKNLHVYVLSKTWKALEIHLESRVSYHSYFIIEHR